MENNYTPLYTVYNDIAFSRFISGYHNYRLIIIEVIKDKDLITQLPFIQVKSKWVSLPYASALGIGKLTKYLDHSEINNFVSYLTNYGFTKDIKQTKIIFQVEEIKNLKFDAKKNSPEWQVRSFHPFGNSYFDRKVLSILKLHKDSKLQFSEFSRNLRRKIRKGYKNNLVVKSGHIEMINDFYQTFSRNNKRLGSPVHKKNFYESMIQSFGPDRSKVFLVVYKEKVIGASIVLNHKDFWENIYFATQKKYNKLYTSYLLHWEMIKYTIKQSGNYYSFGRSNINNGVHKYKMQWGTNDYKIYWNSSKPQKRNVRDFKVFPKMWSLLPHFIHIILGPKIASKYY